MLDQIQHHNNIIYPWLEYDAVAGWEGGPSCQSALGFKTWPAAACPTNLRLIHLFYSQAAAFVELMPYSLLFFDFKLELGLTFYIPHSYMRLYIAPLYSRIHKIMFGCWLRLKGAMLWASMSGLGGIKIHTICVSRVYIGIGLGRTTDRSADL